MLNLNTEINLNINIKDLSFRIAIYRLVGYIIGSFLAFALFLSKDFLKNNFDDSQLNNIAFWGFSILLLLISLFLYINVREYRIFQIVARSTVTKATIVIIVSIVASLILFLLYFLDGLITRYLLYFSIILSCFMFSIYLGKSIDDIENKDDINKNTVYSLAKSVKNILIIFSLIASMSNIILFFEPLFNIIG